MGDVAVDHSSKTNQPRIGDVANINLDPLASPVVVTVTEPAPLAALSSDHLASIAFRRRQRPATEA